MTRAASIVAKTGKPHITPVTSADRTETRYLVYRPGRYAVMARDFPEARWTAILAQAPTGA